MNDQPGGLLGTDQDLKVRIHSPDSRVAIIVCNCMLAYTWILRTWWHVIEQYYFYFGHQGIKCIDHLHTSYIQTVCVGE